MKKLSKILASVLTLSMAMSTVVNAASTYDNPLYENDFSSPMTSGHAQATQVAGLAGKDEADMVGTGACRPTFNNYNSASYVSSKVVTYEASFYLGTASEVKFQLQNASNANNNARYGIKLLNDGTVKTFHQANYVAEDYQVVSGVSIDVTAWNKIAIEVNQKTNTISWYVNGVCIQSNSDASLGTDGYFADDINISATNAYIDNIRMYPAEYDPKNDVMPVAAEELSFMEKTMTVAEAKELALATQAEGKAAVHVYKDSVFGTEAEDTETLVAGWYVVITSKGGDLYRKDGIYKVLGSIEVDSVVYSGTTVTGTLSNYVDTAVPAMTMILVEDGGKVVYSSETKTNIGKGTVEFTIEGVDSLSNAEVFFVNDWTDPYAVLNKLYDVTD